MLDFIAVDNIASQNNVNLPLITFLNPLINLIDKYMTSRKMKNIKENINVGLPQVF